MANETREPAPRAMSRTPAADGLAAALYDELRRLAARALRHERKGHTMQATALVHEAYLALAARPDREWNGVEHFRSAAARAIRRILVDHARRRAALKRGGGTISAELGELCRGAVDADRLLELDEALEELRAVNERLSRVVELRWFAGLGIDETAAELGVSPRTVDGDWRLARAWLRRRLEESA